MGRATILSAALLAAIAVAGVICSVAAPALAARAVPEEFIVGNWRPIKDVNDPHIQELGGWAVAEHVRLVNDGLSFRKVVRGEEQVVSGVNYRLVLQVTNRDGTEAIYGAVVYEQVSTKKRQLLAFHPAN